MPYCPFYTWAWVGILTAAFNYSSQQLLGRPCPIDSIEPIHSDDGAAWLALHHQYASYLNLDEPRIIAQYDLPDITRFWTRGWIPPQLTSFHSFFFVVSIILYVYDRLDAWRSTSRPSYAMPVGSNSWPENSPCTNDQECGTGK